MDWSLSVGHCGLVAVSWSLWVGRCGSVTVDWSLWVVRGGSVPGSVVCFVSGGVGRSRCEQAVGQSL